jgi:hypothetical protein
MRRTAIAAVLACASLLAVSIVSPAFGGPSIGSVAKTAKKALKTAKKGSRTASAAKRTAATARTTATSARETAASAQSLAGAANGKADQALARPVVTVGGITPVEVAVAIPPGGFETTAAVCPAGQRAISGGVVSVSSQGGVWVDIASGDRAAWIGGGEDLGSSGGTLNVTAYCAPGGQATAASNPRPRIRRELRALERQKAASGVTAHASHRCSSSYKHAVTPGGHKCLRAGQYCSTKTGYARVYKSKGFVCKGGRLRNR